MCPAPRKDKRGEWAPQQAGGQAGRQGRGQGCSVRGRQAGREGRKETGVFSEGQAGRQAGNEGGRGLQ